MKKLLLVLLLLLLTGCASFHISTMNHDPIHNVEGSDVKVINNNWELEQHLRNNFNFRYNFAQYALSQPTSFDWRFNRYHRFNIYNGFNSFYGYNYTPWDRHQIWNNWVWNYPFSNGIGWSYSWNNRRWSSNQWGNPYGWNDYYGWNNRYRWNRGYRNSNNVAYHSGRRSSVNQRNGRVQSTIQNRIVKRINPRTRTNIKLKRNIRTKITPIQPIIRNNNSRRNNNNRPIIRNNNTRPNNPNNGVKGNSNRKN